jgi:hypothetical protein
LQHADEQTTTSDGTRHDVGTPIALIGHLLRDFFENSLVPRPHVLVIEGRHVHRFLTSSLRFRQHDVLQVRNGFLETLAFLDHLRGAGGSNFGDHHRFRRVRDNDRRRTSQRFGGENTGETCIPSGRGVEVDAVGVGGARQGDLAVVPDSAAFERARGLERLELEEDSASAA